MKRLITLLVSLLILGLMGCICIEAVSLVPNGSFEQLDDQGWPVDFGSQVFAGNIKYAVDNQVSRTGNNSVVIESDTTGRGRVDTYVNVTERSVYQITVWYRTEATVKADTIRVRLLSFPGKAFKEEHAIESPNGKLDFSDGNLMITAYENAVGEWKPITLTFQVPSGVNRIQIELFNWRAEGKIWFDDLSMVEIVE